MSDPILKLIKNRRSSIRFKSTPIKDEKIERILEAGRWAPSWTNAQPWRFIVIKDEKTKARMSDTVSTIFKLSIKEAPICIAICVNPKKDPFHFVEDGAIATQNMALMAQGLGLSTSWIGVFSFKNERNSIERKLKEILRIPNEWRLISILPVGIPKYKESKTRKNISELMNREYFETGEDDIKKLDVRKKSPDEIPKKLYPSSAREIEPVLV